MGSSKPPPPPDYGPIAAAQKEAAQIAAQVAREQLAWAREQYAMDREVLDRVLAVMLPAMELESSEAAKLRDRYNTVFQPIEDDLIREAREFASPERIEQEAARVSAEAALAFQQRRAAAAQTLEQFGIDPSQTRARALDAQLNVQQAATQAALANQARTNVENVGRALRGEAINIGRGLPSNVAGAYGTAIDAGRTGLRGALETTASGASTMGTPVQWSDVQARNLANWGNMLNTGYQNQLQAWSAAQQNRSGLGSVLGTVAGIGMSALTSPFRPWILGGFTHGGAVPPDPRDPEGTRDGVEVRVSGGEYVVPASVVRRLGTDYFDKLVRKYGEAEDAQAAHTRMALNVPGGAPPGPDALPPDQVVPPSALRGR